MTELDLVKKRQQVETATNELRLMELEGSISRTQKEIEAFKKAMGNVATRQKSDLQAAEKAAAERDAAEKAAG